MKIRHYESKDETGWLQCRVLSFLDTAYYDHVLKEKERYANPSIELVAQSGNEIVGLLDVELEAEPGSVCSKREGLGGMIWHLAVHPDYRRQGIGGRLLEEAMQLARLHRIQRLEAWTRDDPWVQSWYGKMGFARIESYLQVFMDGGRELRHAIESKMPGLYPVFAFAHYTGENHAEIRSKFSRVHETNLYELVLTDPKLV